MQLLMTADQVAGDRETWLKVRQGDDASGARIGASDIGKIMGLPGSYRSAYWLWAEKTGQLDGGDDELPEVVEFGTYCEPFSAYLLAKDQPGWHITAGGLYAHDQRPWQIATFDRLMHPEVEGAHPGVCSGPEPMCRPSAPVQLKNCAFSDWTDKGPPLAYLAQVIWEASVMGAQRGYLVAFDRNAVKIAVMTVEMDDRAQASLEGMLAEAERFRGWVARREPPAIDASEATTTALKQVHGVDPDATAIVPHRLAARWARARAAEGRARERKQRYLNQLLARAGAAATWYVRDPASGELAKIATRSASPRAGYWVNPNPRVDSVRPARTWTP
jgi:predicted phage-related endonuclease